MVNNGTLGVWSNGDAEVRMGVVQDNEASTNICAWIGFENVFGFGVISYREEGDSGKFVLSAGVPDAFGPFEGSLSDLRTLRANIECPWIQLGTNTAISNWPSYSGIDSATAGQIATDVVYSTAKDVAILSYGSTNIQLSLTNKVRRYLAATNAVTISLPAAPTNQSQDIVLAIWPTASVTWESSNLNMGTVTLATNVLKEILFHSSCGTNGWLARSL